MQSERLSDSGSRFRRWSVRAGLVALALSGLWILGSWVRHHANPPPPAISSAGDDVASSRLERARRVCERARTRFLRGGSPTPLDVEGWVVELLLLRRIEQDQRLADAPQLDHLFPKRAGTSERSVAPTVAPDFAEIEGPGTSVEVDAFDPAVDARSGALEYSGLRAAFSGRYVAPYFDPDKRYQYLRLAAHLAHELNASYGGGRASRGSTDLR